MRKNNMSDMELKEHFKSNSIIDENGCWVWQKCQSRDGYGFIWRNRKQCRTHRISYEIFKGSIPDGKQILHKCDNRLCVNPGHLFVGTHQDNMKDKINKKRHNFGESHGRSKLTEDDVLNIRKSKLSERKIAKLYSVNRTAINKIRNYTNWSHL